MSKHPALPLDAGVSLKPEHFDVAGDSDVTNLWFEVHPENYFVAGGPRINQLRAIAEKYPLSLHGVAASLAGPERIPAEHLRKLKTLYQDLQPGSVSEHFAWSSWHSHYLVNLLPAPRTAEVRAAVLESIDQIQCALGTQLLIENPAHYLKFQHDYEEPEFLQEIVDQSGCGWLLDLNNLYVSKINIGLNPEAYLSTIRLDQVGEIHVAGHRPDPAHADLLIDSHDQPVSVEVWALLDEVLQRAGPKPVLVERDANLPTFDVLLQERAIASGKLTSL